MLTRKFFLSLIILVMALATAACGSDRPVESESETGLVSAALAEGEALKIVATTGIIGDIVGQIGGPDIELTTLLPTGADPHTFEPTPRDLAAIAEAHVIFANGMALESFLDDTIKSSGSQAALVYVSDGIEPRHFETTHAEDEEAHHDESHQHEDEHKDREEEEEEVNEHPAAEASHEGEEHLHDAHADGGIDPHTWTSPANAIIFAQNIEQALGALDPARAETYAANAQAYTTELEELDRWVEMQIATIPADNRKLVTDHAIFGYYADRYGLEQIGAVIPSFSTNAEPSAQEMARLSDAIKTHGVAAIFVGNTVNPTLSEQIAADTGSKLLRLYTGSLGPAGSGVESYLDYIRYNTETIVAGLGNGA